MLLLFPLSLMAADSRAAMLHTNGTAWLNGSVIPKASAIFPGDLVQTRPDSVANINASGSSVAVLSDSLVTFEGEGMAVDHGSVTIATSKRMIARAGDVKVAPVGDAWTEFQVSQVDGKVQIIARKGDVSITDATGTTTLGTGQQTTRYASFSDRRRRGGGAAPAAGGGLFDSPVFFYGGVAAVTGLTIWVLLQGSKPFSPSQP
jgi:hypothetical protein